MRLIRLLAAYVGHHTLREADYARSMLCMWTDRTLHYLCVALDWCPRFRLGGRDVLCDSARLHHSLATVLSKRALSKLLLVRPERFGALHF